MNTNFTTKSGTGKAIAKNNSTGENRLLKTTETNSTCQDSEFWPKFDKTVRWTAKADLYYLNGTTNHIKIEMPIMLGGGTEELHKYFSGWIKELTSSYIQITHFKITLGSIDNDGTEHWTWCYKPEQVPLGKVWVHNWPLGIWISPQDVLKGREIIHLQREAAGKHWKCEPFPFPYSEPSKYPEVKIY